MSIFTFQIKTMLEYIFLFKKLKCIFSRIVNLLIQWHKNCSKSYFREFDIQRCFNCYHNNTLQLKYISRKFRLFSKQSMKQIAFPYQLWLPHLNFSTKFNSTIVTEMQEKYTHTPKYKPLLLCFGLHHVWKSVFEKFFPSLMRTQSEPKKILKPKDDLQISNS